jgi:hypothetical protein
MMERPMTAIPDNDQALLTRRQLAAALSAAGYPVAASTLNTMATRGGGPPYQKFGPRPLYRWGPAIKWAEERLSKPARTNAELRRSILAPSNHGAR